MSALNGDCEGCRSGQENDVHGGRGGRGGRDARDGGSGGGTLRDGIGQGGGDEQRKLRGGRRESWPQRGCGESQGEGQPFRSFSGGLCGERKRN